MHNRQEKNIFNFHFRYTGPLLDEKCLQKALEGGAKSPEYTQLVEWICKELKSLCNLDETVNAVSTEDEASNFLIEISSFLKELGKDEK